MLKQAFGAVALGMATAAGAQVMPVEPPQSALNQQFDHRTQADLPTPRPMKSADAIFHGSSDEMSPARKAKLAAKAKAAAEAPAAKQPTP